MRRKHSPGCPCCGPTPPPPDIPDDGTGCCAFLGTPGELPASLTVTNWIDSVNVTTPFVWQPRPLQIVPPPGADYLGFPHLASDGYYINGPFCLGGNWLIDNPFGPGQIGRAENRRYYLVLACTKAVLPIYASELEPVNTPRVRLFVVSNRGQLVTDISGELPDVPETCDDGEDVYNPDPWVYDVIDPDGPDTIISGYVYGVISSDLTGFDVFAPGGIRANCRPLCYVVDGRFGGAWTDPDAGSITGVIGDSECPEDPIDGCKTTITVVNYCPDNCPDGLDWTLTAKDVDLEITYGPAFYFFEIGTDDACLWRKATVEVVVPFDEETGDPISPYEFEVFRTIGVGSPASIGTVEITDCQPASIVSGTPPSLFRITGCLTGCPEGGLPGVLLTVQIRSEDGEEFLFQSRFFADGSGCFTAEMPLPDEGGDYLLRLIFSPHEDGYAETILDVPAELPGPNEECLVIPLGDIPAEIDDDYVCTCAGPLPKCLRWDGNGSEITLTWDDSEDAWLGLESFSGGFVSDGSFCQDEYGAAWTSSSPVKLEVKTDGEDCVFLATRMTPYCVCGPIAWPSGPPCYTSPCDGISPGGLIGTPRLAAYSPEIGEPVAFTISVQRVVITSPWGPLDFFAGQAFLDWTRPNGDDDPNCCYAPCVAYTNVSVTRCS